MIAAEMEKTGHQQLNIFTNKSAKVRVFIALHDTTLGPGMGGVRRWAYHTAEQAISDVLRLSEAMSYKAAVAGLPFGGAKAVIWCSPNAVPSPTEAFYFGECVDTFGGRYIAAPDVGTNETYMEWAAGATQFVAGRPAETGGAGSPSPATARGVFAGIRACVRRLEGHDSVAGKVVAVQGAGAVGGGLVELLVSHGAKVLLADVSVDRVKSFAEKYPAAVVPVPADDVLRMKCDILAPCALGGILTATVIDHLRCYIVAGSANNPLERPDEDAERLTERGILYAPDFVINAGGLIHVGGSWLGWPPDEINHRINAIADTLRQIFVQAGSCGNTQMEALRLARTRLLGGQAKISQRRALMPTRN